MKNRLLLRCASVLYNAASRLRRHAMSTTTHPLATHETRLNPNRTLSSGDTNFVCLGPVFNDHGNSLGPKE